MIEFMNISKKFKDRYILNNFNLKVPQGSKTLLYGKSGIGKTTIFRILLGFTQPDEGEIFFKEEKINAKNIWDLRKETAYLGQELDVLEGTVQDIINNILSYKVNENISFDKNKIIKLMNYFQLEDNVLEKDYQTLSGGEKQRILISIFSFLNKKIYLLDEITSSLDKDMKNKVIDFFLNKKEWTVISISHDHEWLNKDSLNIIEMGGNNNELGN